MIEYFKQKGDHSGLSVASPGQNERQQSQRTSGYSGERDDQDFACEEDLHNYEMFPVPLHGSDGCSQLVEDRETDFLTKTVRRTREGNQVLQSDCAHQCRVDVVRVLCNDAHGKGEGARDLEKTSHWRSQLNKLSTSVGVGDTSVTGALGAAGRELSHDET